MKKIAFMIMALLLSLTASAQFEKGKTYLGASLSGLDLSYKGLTKGHMSVQGKAGYFFEDNFLGMAQLGYEKYKDVPYSLTLGAGARYYIVQNGLYLGASALYRHCDNYDDLMPSVQAGYSFFISRTVTIEPEVYYEQSFKNHKDYSQIGLRIGVGIYLFKDAKQN